MRSYFVARLLWLLLSGVFSITATAWADWPTYRADATRSGYSPSPLPMSLRLAWSYEAGTPAPAWPRSGRMSFDRALHAVVTDGSVYFGHSADHCVYRLDAATGRGGPIYTADGPIRFAPAVWQDRLFVVSDDGMLVCLSLEGERLWSHRGGLDNSLRLGNEQLISKWPARGAPVIVEDVIYYSAGIWPTDEIFVYALDAATGDPIWINDDSGGIYMPQPHGGAEAESGVSAQGYLVAAGTKATNVPFPGPESEPNRRESVASRDQGSAVDLATETSSQPSRLLLPTGRAVPASFDLATGKFEYFHLQQYGKRGGSATMAIGPMFFNSGIAFDTSTGQAGETLGDGAIVAVPGGLIRSTPKQVIAYRWIEQTIADRRGTKSTVWALEPQWTTDGVDGGTALIVSDQTVIAGGDGTIALLNRKDGLVTQRLGVEGIVHGLASSDGRLIVSTETGRLYGFESSDQENYQREPWSHPKAEPKSQWPAKANVVAAAEEILNETGIREGYCLDFACGDGHLAYELAIRSDLRIYAVDDDPQTVQLARERLQAAGVYGSRVTVHHVENLDRLPHPQYFANLIVSGRSVDHAEVFTADPANIPQDDTMGWQKTLRPYGGVARWGSPGNMSQHIRGPLEGAGQWTHQYADAENQLCSTDQHLQGSLGMLWYRDIDLDVPQRHGRAPSPLFYDGLLYHEGINELVCVDAYNGRVVWRYDLPGILKAYDGDELMGVSGTGSNYCIGESGVYVRQAGECLRLDRLTGQRLATFSAINTIDGQPGIWGYISLDGNRLYGSLADPDHQVTFRYKATTGDMSQQLTESRTLFAVDSSSGELQWRYDAKDSIRHNAIAVDGDRVYCIDRPQAKFDRTKDGKATDHPPGVLLAIDSATGDVLWKQEHDIDGTMLAVSPTHRRLLMSYQPTRFSLASEVGGKLSVFSTDDGELSWRKDATYASRPMINDYTIYAQGGAWDLLSGEPQPFDFSRSYGCGVLAGSRYLMVYRSATLGYQDLLGEGGTQNYGGMRPGCWINAIPAGGLVLVPDASAGCTCSYLNQSWMALEPMRVDPPKMVPRGGSFTQPVEVQLTHTEPAAVIRYTVDGSSPRDNSPVYDGPITVDAQTTLRARVFSSDGRHSRTADEEYVIDRNSLSLADEAWRVWDVSSEAHGAPSHWSVTADTVTQTSNIYLGSAGDSDPETPRYGTMRIYRPGQTFADGTIELEIRSGDDDGIGLAFRLQDERHHYLWAADMQRQFRILALKDGETYQVLRKNQLGYQKNTWLALRIELEGPRIRVIVDGQEDFMVEDNRFATGTIALYTWGCQNVQFRSLRFIPNP